MKRRILVVGAVLACLAILGSAVSTLYATQGSEIKKTEPAKETPLALQITSVTSTVVAGEKATLIAKTAPGALCKISVYYTSTKSAADGLLDKTAEASGNVSWTWRVGTDMAAGSYRIEVTSTLGEKHASQTVNFTVTK
jgi:flagellar capping protein FliD